MEPCTDFIGRDDIDIDHSDSRWPKNCECGYVFSEEDSWQISFQHVHVNLETGKEALTGSAAPVGAMWYADYLLPIYEGPDGHVLCVMTPGGEWVIDSEASNCTRPGDKSHHCWIRTGTPPNITVGKSGGETCNAGAGSIQCGDYHGFLINGVFT